MIIVKSRIMKKLCKCLKNKKFILLKKKKFFKAIWMKLSNNIMNNNL